MFMRSRVLGLTGKKLTLRLNTHIFADGHSPLDPPQVTSHDKCSQAIPISPIPCIINQRTKNSGGLGMRLDSTPSAACYHVLQHSKNDRSLTITLFFDHTLVTFFRLTMMVQDVLFNKHASLVPRPHPLTRKGSGDH